MATNHLIFLSVPGLRPGDIDKATTPTLHDWANRGTIAELEATFPCVTSCVQVSMRTGAPPGTHGVIANGFYDRNRHEVAFWAGGNDLVAGEQIWDVIRAKRPEFTSAVWHVQNIKGAFADYIVTPAPIHEDDGTTKLWCYSKPEGTYQRLVDAMGHFPLQHYWGPLANIESTKWTLQAAAWLIRQAAPNYQWIYIPHLDYAAQKYGPNSAEAKAALVELDQQLAMFAGQVADSSIAGNVVYLVAGEYALTNVTGVLYPNRVLRQAGLLAIKEKGGAECIDLPGSTAFAMVDHQCAHVFVQQSDGSAVARSCEALRAMPGVELYAGEAREQLGLNHTRSGDIVLACDDAHWFAYYWWLEDAAAPPFARTVDIHRKPGYDPVELFFDPKSRGIPLDASLIRGSHGVPATGRQHRTALICSSPSPAIETGHTYHDTDIKQITLRLLSL